VSDTSRKIPLTQGAFCVVDAEDFDVLSKYRWILKEGHGRPYVVRSAGAHNLILMHRQLLDAPKGLEVDHIDGDTLNNRRGNLRLCTRAQNMRNRTALHINNTTGYRGVTFSARKNAYIARIKVDGKFIHLGSRHTALTAGLLYDAAARQLFGEFYHSPFETNSLLHLENVAGKAEKASAISNSSAQQPPLKITEVSHAS